MKDFIIPQFPPGSDPQDERDMGTPARSGAPVSLSIDGFAVTVPEGTSVMRAAAEAGIMVHKLCASDNMEAFGSCRLCVVEIEGRKGTPASCTTPVAEGMVVHTQSGKVKRIRKHSAHGRKPGWGVVPLITKANDDVRQEVFIMQARIM